MTVGDILAWLDSIAPFASQEDFDQCGIQLGDPSAEVHKVLFALDATLPIVQEAEKLGVDLIITHHPIMFGGIKHIRYDNPENALVAEIARAHIHMIATHTNMDQAPGGIADALAETLMLQNIALAGESRYIRVGTLHEAMTARAFLPVVNRLLTTHARLYGNPETRLTRVAVGSGAIGEGYADAAQAGAQAFVVGEIKHSDLIAAQALGLTVFEAGHYPTEQPGLVALYRRFSQAALAGHWPLEVLLTALHPYDCTV
ncbi:MAG: Nif3-like dinuclear metal center hexameric protein [Eubacteriales bacterium]|nr:Nif3-like dinuclear metal center hexameric protein [Eubacteriales bacterium]